MKKITLLLIVAVFAIGIQSCSTEQEEEVLEVLTEEQLLRKKHNIPENAIHFGNTYYSKAPDTISYYVHIYVRYPYGTSISEKIDHANNIGSQYFDDFYVVMDNGCHYVDEWYIRVKKACYTTISCYPYDKGGSKVADSENLGDIDTDLDDGEISPPGEDNPYYLHCSDIAIDYPEGNDNPRILINTDGNLYDQE